MNIFTEIKFNTDQPFVLVIRNSDASNLFAVGLTQNQVLPKHKTQLPTLLIVLCGSVLFRIQSQEIRLSTFDTYQIPIDVAHEVVGIDEENVFLISKDKSA